MRSTLEKENRSLELSLKESEIRYRRLFEAAQDGILILNAETGMIEDVNPYLITMLGYTREEFVEKKLWEVGAFKDIKASKDAFEVLQDREYIRYEDLPLKAKDGRMVQVEFISNVYWVGNEKVIQCNIRDNAEHKLIIAALQANEKKYRDLINQSPDGYFIIELSGNILTVNEAICKELEFSEEEFLSMSIWEIVPGQYLEQYRERLTKVLKGESLKESAEYEVLGKHGGIHYVEVLSAPRYSGGDVIGFQGIARDITARKRAENELQKSEEKFRKLVENLPTVVYMNDVGDASSTIYISPQIETLMGYTSLEWLADPKLWLKTLHPEDRQDVLAKIAHTDQNNLPFEMDYRMIARDGTQVWVHDQIRLVKDPQDKPQYWQGIMLDITERKQAEQKIRRQIDYLTALQDIDRTIASDVDLRLSLHALIAKARSLLTVDAAAVILIDYNTNALEFAAGEGFRANIAEGSAVRMDETHAGRVALGHHIIKIPDPKSETRNTFMTGYLKGEDFVSYHGVPLVVKGKVIGVFEVFQRVAVRRDQEWLDFLNALAGQAAIAISNAQLFESLQQSNSELTQAYDATIQGWSHALDLRDKETEGHSLRVTKMAVELSRAFGLSDVELVQVRWGSLLHDIGKMGVPDGILLKPGTLTEEEWVTMKKHPVFAHEMLAPIRYLRLALDIPYCHHEKWDGTGYPRGLSGDQIPLIARIFAVVDVWDAVTSERPYRSAWTKSDALKYIQTSSGTHFDPQVVNQFLDLIGREL